MAELTKPRFVRLGSWEPAEYEVFTGDQLVGYVRKITQFYIQFGTYTYWRAYTLNRTQYGSSDYNTRGAAATALIALETTND